MQQQLEQQPERLLAARGLELVWAEDNDDGGGIVRQAEDEDPRVQLGQPPGLGGGGQALVVTNLLPALEELGCVVVGWDGWTEPESRLTLPAAIPI